MAKMYLGVGVVSPVILFMWKTLSHFCISLGNALALVSYKGKMNGLQCEVDVHIYFVIPY